MGFNRNSPPRFSPSRKNGLGKQGYLIIILAAAAVLLALYLLIVVLGNWLGFLPPHSVSDFPPGLIPKGTPLTANCAFPAPTNPSESGAPLSGQRNSGGSGSNQPIATLKGHRGSVTSLAFSPDGETLASGSGFQDNTIVLWNTASRLPTAVFTGHTKEVLAMTFSSDGHTLYSGSSDKTIKEWDLPGCKQSSVIITATLSTVSNVAFNSDGHDYVFRGERLENGGNPRNSTWQEALQLFDLQGRLIRQQDAGDVSSGGLALSPDGRTVAVGSLSGINLIDSTSGWSLGSLPTSNGKAVLAFSPGGRLLVTSSGSTIELWDIAGKTKLASFRDPTTVSDEFDFNILTLAFSPDGKCLASGSSKGLIKIWDVASQKRLKIFKNNYEIKVIAFSPDGKSLATGDGGGIIKLWQT